MKPMSALTTVTWCPLVENNITKNMKNLIVISDAGLDPDDVVATLLLANAHKKGLVNLLGFVGNMYPAEQRAALIKGVLKSEGLHDIPVGIGTNCNLTREVKSYEFDFELANTLELLSGEELLISQLNSSADSSITLLLISGLTDACDLITNHTELFKSKVAEVYVMGGGCFKDNELVIDNTASNNKFDLDSSNKFYSKLKELHTPLKVLTRFAAYSCFVSTDFYNELANQSAVGKYLKNIQQSSITSLWKYANSQPTTERQNRKWFCTTFCKQDDIPVSVEESPWEYIKGFSLYDPLTALWVIYPELFNPTIQTINFTEYNIVGVSSDNPGVIDSENTIKVLKELVYG